MTPGLRLMNLCLVFSSRRKPQPQGDGTESDQYDDEISLFHKDREKVAASELVSFYFHLQSLIFFFTFFVITKTKMLCLNSYKKVIYNL